MESDEAERRHTPNIDSVTDESRCVICLEEISEKAIATPCCHIFDFICLASWLQQNSLCPLCKCDVSSVDYGFDTLQGVRKYRVNSTKLYLQNDTPRALPPASWVLRSRPRRSNTGPVAWRSRRSRLPSPIPSTAFLNRRRIYQHRLYSAHVGSNRISRFQDLTPTRFNSDSELISRARKWIRRELQVLDMVNFSPDALPSSSREDRLIDTYTNLKASTLNEQRLHRRRASNAEFLLEYILAILKTIDIKGSQGQAVEMLSDFLGRENSQLFLHELQSWLRSPYTDLETWDRHVQYPGGNIQSDSQAMDESEPNTNNSRSPIERLSRSSQNMRQKRPRRSSDEYLQLDNERRKRRLYDRYVPD